ncbi:EB1C [Symbiodinium pilosum]|uniref:EB1C protein n=1 Tax=Symbiodinium pilosum TaxID=2952 RepID=A0A812ISZ0_SYMPI|nr:EB1C [Symbiodinium pilosum]
MDGAFFVSRTELLSWLNSTFQLSLDKVEQCANGAVYCQIIDACHSGAVPMKKVNWMARDEHQCIPNYKVLQQAFSKVGIQRHIEVDKLVRGKYQDNLEMLQWIKNYFERTFQGTTYNAAARRSDNLPDWARPSDGSSQPLRRPLSNANAVASKVPKHGRPGGGDGYQRSSTAPNLALLQEEHERIREEVVDLKITVDGLETERDFYFQKLRDIEIMCQAWEENPDASMTVNKFVEEVQNILYAKDDEIGDAEGEIGSKVGGFLLMSIAANRVGSRVQQQMHPDGPYRSPEEAKKARSCIAPVAKRLSEQPAPPPPGSLSLAAGFVDGLDEFDGGVSRSSVGLLDQSMLEMRLAGDFYNVPENVPRGVQLDDASMFHSYLGGEEHSFDTPFDFGHQPGKLVQKVQDFPELSFPAHVTPAQEPMGGCLNTCVELRIMNAPEAFECAFNFFKTKASASFSKIRIEKLAMKATVFHESSSGVLVSCVLKARVYSSADDASKLLFEFRRCSGDALAFAHAFDEASKYLRSRDTGKSLGDEAGTLGDNIASTGQEQEHSHIQPLVDMVAARSPSNLEAEAVAALAALVLGADTAGTTALLAALRDVQKILVELCVERNAIDTAYPAARLVSKLLRSSTADAEAQQIASELTQAVCSAKNLDWLVRGELAKAVRAVAEKRTMQFPMPSGLDGHQLEQALRTLEARA